MPRIVSRVTRRLEGRFAASAIMGFLMFSGTFAVTTLVSATRAQGLPPSVLTGEAVAAELDVRELLDERVQLHLQRLHGISATLR